MTFKTVKQIASVHFIQFDAANNPTSFILAKHLGMLGLKEA